MKKRLDLILFEKGLFQSREKAKAVIMAGCIYVENQKSDKPGILYEENCNVEVRDNSIPYVSRGGLKFKKAIEVFGIDLKDKVAMDIGASTGGFTDCMLQNGVKKVYAVDVGYGQLAWILRNDSRVVNMEKTNVRYLNTDLIEEQLDFLSIDVSFISLCLVLSIGKSLLKEKGKVVCLIKPQFETKRENIGKNGVVRDKKIHIDVIEKIIKYVVDNGFKVLGLDFSPIKGPKGNIEYLVYLEKSEECMGNQFDVKGLVEESHGRL